MWPHNLDFSAHADSQMNVVESLGPQRFDSKRAVVRSVSPPTVSSTEADAAEAMPATKKAKAVPPPPLLAAKVEKQMAVKSPSLAGSGRLPATPQAQVNPKLGSPPPSVPAAPGAVNRYAGMVPMPMSAPTGPSPKAAVKPSMAVKVEQKPRPSQRPTAAPAKQVAKPSMVPAPAANTEALAGTGSVAPALAASVQADQPAAPTLLSDTPSVEELEVAMNAAGVDAEAGRIRQVQQAALAEQHGTPPAPNPQPEVVTSAACEGAAASAAAQVSVQERARQAELAREDAIRWRLDKMDEVELEAQVDKVKKHPLFQQYEAWRRVEVFGIGQLRRCQSSVKVRNMKRW